MDVERLSSDRDKVFTLQEFPYSEYKSFHTYGRDQYIIEIKYLTYIIHENFHLANIMKLLFFTYDYSVAITLSLLTIKLATSSNYQANKINLKQTYAQAKLFNKKWFLWSLVFLAKL